MKLNKEWHLKNRMPKKQHLNNGLPGILNMQRIAAAEKFLRS